MPKRGEIYLHTQYKYALGNIDDKYIIILNDISATQTSIAILPATKYKFNDSFKSGCLKGKFEFRLMENEDFFPLKTILQIYTLNNVETSLIEEKDFIKLKNTGTIEYKGNLKDTTMKSLLDCIEYHKIDIDTDIIDLL